MYDIVIKNGTVIDGTGKAKYKANVAVKDSKIAKVGKLNMARGEIEIDAGGKIVSPGFIDVHNHSDSYWRIFLNPELPSLAHQGVTTIIGGNCGASIAPLTDGRIIESIQKWADIKQINVDWLSMAEFREAMAKRKFALNFATLVGHGTLRRGLIHDEVRRLDRKEMELMKNLLEKSLEAGALGLSTGLAYSHEKIAAWDEIVELAEMPIDFHPRHDATGKTYLYIIDRDDSVIRRRFSWGITDEMNISAIETGARILLGEHDFKSFTTQSAHRDDVTIRRIDDISFRQTGSIIAIEITGSGFLYQMVRRIIAALVALAKGDRQTEDIEDLINNPCFGSTGYAAPAKGLILNRVFYNC